jgi:hypothetical protein
MEITLIWDGYFKIYGNYPDMGGYFEIHGNYSDMGGIL